LITEDERRRPELGEREHVLEGVGGRRLLKRRGKGGMKSSKDDESELSKKTAQESAASRIGFSQEAIRPFQGSAEMTTYSKRRRELNCSEGGRGAYNFLQK